MDDLGYHDLSIMGSDYYETPNIDKIATSRFNFSSGYATGSVCSPSRASLMTGKFTARHGITDYIGAPYGAEWRNRRQTKLLPPPYNPHLNHDDVTMPEALKENGYNTFFAGKWHLGGEEQNSLPTDHGFDVNMGGYQLGGPYSGGYFSPFNNPYMTDREEEKGMSLSMKLAKETSTFIEKNKGGKFLAYLSFYAVHSPIQTSEDKWNKYRDKAEAMGIHEDGFEMERLFPIRKHQDNPVYAGLVEQVDDAVGTVLQTLKELNLDENTIVIFTSDNGGVASGDNFSTSNLPLRGGKGYQWEGGIKIPYFVYVPWMNHKGANSKVPVSGADLYPTVLELAGLSSNPGQHQDGISLVPILEGNSIDSRPLYWHYPHYGNQGGEPNSSVRQGDWKLIHYWEDKHDELYNLKEDIGERKDLISNEPERAKAMNSQLMNWLTEVDAKYAVVDTLRDEAAANLVLEDYRNKMLPNQEKRRQDMLKENWIPNDNWWKSKTAKKD